MAAHSSILAWRISGTEEPDRLWSIGSQRLGHNWNNLALMTSIDFMEIYPHINTNTGFPGGGEVKNLPVNAGDVGDVGSIPGLGRFPRGGNGSPLQYSCLENPMDRGAWRAVVRPGEEL